MGIAAAGLAIKALADSDKGMANIYLGTANFISVIVCIFLAAIIFFVVVVLYKYNVINWDAAGVIMIISAANLVAVVMGVGEAAFRATDRYAAGTVFSTSARLFEWIGFIFGLLLFNDFLKIALMILLFRVMAFAAQVFYIKKYIDVGWCFGWGGVNVVKIITKPALQLSAFPVAGLLSIQGVTIAVGSFYGSSAVGIFNACRTYSRVVLQAVNIISNPLLNWMAINISNKNISEVKFVCRRAFMLFSAVGVVLPVLLYVFHASVFYAWTGGGIVIEDMLMAAFLVNSFFVAMYSFPRSILIAANKPGELVGIIVFSAFAQVVCASFGGAYLDMTEMVILLGFFDALILIKSLHASKIAINNLA